MASDCTFCLSPSNLSRKPSSLTRHVMMADISRHCFISSLWWSWSCQLGFTLEQLLTADLGLLIGELFARGVGGFFAFDAVFLCCFLGSGGRRSSLYSSLMLVSLMSFEFWEEMGSIFLLLTVTKSWGFFLLGRSVLTQGALLFSAFGHQPCRIISPIRSFSVCI